MNVSSIVVIPHPQHVEAVVGALDAIDGVEVAAVSPEGRIVATIEAEGDAETIQTYELISHLDGLMSASMVYHQKEDQPEVEISVEA